MDQLMSGIRKLLEDELRKPRKRDILLLSRLILSYSILGGKHDVVSELCRLNGFEFRQLIDPNLLV